MFIDKKSLIFGNEIDVYSSHLLIKFSYDEMFSVVFNLKKNEYNLKHFFVMSIFFVAIRILKMHSLFAFYFPFWCKAFVEFISND